MGALPEVPELTLHCEWHPCAMLLRGVLKVLYYPSLRQSTKLVGNTRLSNRQQTVNAILNGCMRAIPSFILGIVQLCRHSRTCFRLLHPTYINRSPAVAQQLRNIGQQLEMGARSTCKRRRYSTLMVGVGVSKPSSCP
eukprot:2526107-Amphidinium_carterae.1